MCTRTHARIDAVLSQIPADISSLTMKFLGSRVTASSSKNFLFEMPTPEGMCLPACVCVQHVHERVCGTAGTTKHVIQFGKLCPATFSLDFKYPLCPLQAFGLFLSANGWTITKS